MSFPGGPDSGADAHAESGHEPSAESGAELSPDSARDGPPRAALICAVVVAVAAVIGLLVVAATRVERPPDPAAAPVPIAAAPAPDATSRPCTALLDALPDRLGDYRRAPAAPPVPAGAAAWRRADDPDPVVLRCGIERPVDFVVGVPVSQVDAVAWFRAGRVAASEDPSGRGRVTWVAVDRPVYVALTLPDGSGPSPIQGLSAGLARTVPAVPPRPGAAR